MATAIRQAVLFLSTTFLFTCSDPQYPFSYENVRISASCSENAKVDDSLTITVAVEGRELIDSIVVSSNRCFYTLCNDDAKQPWITNEHLRLKCIEAGKSFIRFSAYLTNGTTRKDSCEVAVSGLPVTITEQPASACIEEGSALHLSVKTTGTGGTQYAWCKDDSLLSRESNRMLIIDSATLQDAGVYYCIVWNEWGAPDTSSNAIVAVSRKVEVFSLAYDTGLVIIRQNLPKDAIVTINGTGATTIALTYSNLDSVAAFVDSVCSTIRNNAAIFRVVPHNETEPFQREITITAIFSNGMMDDTAHLKFCVKKYELHPIWESGTFKKTRIAGEEIALPLLSLTKTGSRPVISLRLLDGTPEYDVIDGNGSTYHLKAVYAKKGRYPVAIEASDIDGIKDTMAIDLNIE